MVVRFNHKHDGVQQKKKTKKLSLEYITCCRIIYALLYKYTGAGAAGIAKKFWLVG